MASQLVYTQNSLTSHDFSFTTYFAFGSNGNCPPFSYSITFSGNTMHVKGLYNTCGAWPANMCIDHDVVNYNQEIAENIQYIVMSTNIIDCGNGEPELIENIFTQTYDRSLNTNEFLSKSVVLFPNPAKDVLTITGAEGIDFETFTVYDLVGKKVLESKSNVIGVEALANGVYLLEARSDALKLIRKFVKE